MTNDTELVAGLLGVYQRNFREEHYGGQWREIFDRCQRPLHDVFMRGDVEAAAKALAQPATNHLLYGFENMFAGSAGEGGDADLLQLLAISLGAERLPNAGHERSSWRARARAVVRQLRPIDIILRRMDDAFGARVEFPNPYPGEGGTTTSRGVASYRAVNALYQASLLYGDVLEIGGGLGRTAYYAVRRGVRSYTIFDLPFTGLSQGYFLAKTLGRDHGVRLLSPDEFFASSARYDVALNVDSMTELNRTMAQRYADTVSARAIEFISINHESNPFTVRELFDQVPRSRHPYWLRPDYVVETWQFGRQHK